MRTLLISLVIWVLVVPAVIALFMVFTCLVAFVQDLYFASTLLALAFAVPALLWGPFWCGLFCGSDAGFFQGNRQPNSTQEEKSAKGHPRS